MLSLDDCVALSFLTEDEIAAIAEHEHLPMIVAAELGSYLVQTPEGRHCIDAMIREDIKNADAKGDLLHALTLKLILRHYLSEHPDGGGLAKSAASPAEDLVRKVLEQMPPRCA